MQSTTRTKPAVATRSLCLSAATTTAAVFLLFGGFGCCDLGDELESENEGPAFEVGPSSSPVTQTFRVCVKGGDPDYGIALRLFASASSLSSTGAEATVRMTLEAPEDFGGVTDGPFSEGVVSEDRGGTLSQHAGLTVGTQEYETLCDSGLPLVFEHLSGDPIHFEWLVEASTIGGHPDQQELRIRFPKT